MSSRAHHHHHADHHAPNSVVAECALTALHTEMVLYVVRHRAQQAALSEMNAVTERSAALLAGRLDALSGEGVRSAKEGGGDTTPHSGMSDEDDSLDDSTTDAAFISNNTELNRGACVEYTLEVMGIHAGARITERLLHREPLVRYTPLEVTRFVGNQLWRAIFGKKVDKMKHLDNIYFSLVETQFSWHRCPVAVVSTSSTATTAGVGDGIGSGRMSVAAGGGGGTGSGGGVIIAPGFHADGSVADLEAARQQAALHLEQSQRQLPTQKDVLLYLQGIMIGVVDALLGPGSQALVSAQAMSGGADAQFILDFRQCARL
jgi:hypothetical protein